MKSREITMFHGLKNHEKTGLRRRAATRIPAPRAASTDSCTPSRSGSMDATIPHKVRPDLGWGDTVDGPAKSVHHQLIDGEHPRIYKVSTILLVVQDFATIHSISLGKSMVSS